MSAPISNTHLRVPPGFANILWCFAREVLRVQPPDILKFGMEYFDHLLRLRLGKFHCMFNNGPETGEEDIVKLGVVNDDRYYNNRSFIVSSVVTSFKFQIHIYVRHFFGKI